MSFVETEGILEIMSVMMGIEWTWTAAMNSAFKKNKDLKLWEQELSSLPQCQWPIDMSAILEMKSLQTGAMTSVEMDSAMTTLITGTPEGTCSKICKSSVMTEIQRMEMGAMRDAGWKKDLSVKNMSTYSHPHVSKTNTLEPSLRAQEVGTIVRLIILILMSRTLSLRTELL